MNDKLIIDALVLDEEKGYLTMIEKYTSYVSSIVYGMTRNILVSSDMEELISDVFFKVWSHRKSIEGDSLKGLLAQTARNCCIDEFRKRKETFLSFDDDVLHQSKQNAVHDVFETKEQAEIVLTAVKNFDEPDREIFIRFYYFGEKIISISQTLEINLSTVKTKLRRSRKKLKLILNERGFGYD